MSMKTAYSFAVELKAMQGHSSTTATTALLQESSSFLAVPHQWGSRLEVESGGIYSQNYNSNTQVIFQPLPIPAIEVCHTGKIRSLCCLCAPN